LRIASISPPLNVRTPLLANALVGVDQPTSRATSFNGRALSPCLFEADDFQSLVVAVGQLANFAAWFSVIFGVVKLSLGLRNASVCVVVGHEVQPLPDVRSPDARSAQISSPTGVVRDFQVSANRIPPPKGSLARNLLSKDDPRLALADEMEPMGPEMSLISSPLSFACRAVRLARTTPGPDPSVVGPSRKPQGVGPPTDAGEEVAASVGLEVIGIDVLDAALVHDALWYVPLQDQLSQPCRGFRIVLVVVVGHSCPSSGGIRMVRKISQTR
jgi:hypothetical protein